MARAERTNVLVRLPEPLKKRLADEVSSGKGSLNDVAVGILAKRFGVPFERSGRAGSRPKATGDVLLRMPHELKDKIGRRASERRRSTTDLIVETLSERLGLTRKDTMASSNGRARRSENKVRVAIIGVGNCANSLLQGVEYYKDADPDDFVPGLMHVDLGGYHVRDVEFTAAFDVAANKVGKERPPAIPTTSPASSGRRARTSSSTTSRSAQRTPPSGTRSRSSRPGARW